VISEGKEVWVYGVVPAEASLEALADAGDRLPEVWLLEEGDLAAIVSDPPAEEATATRDRALAHAHVLEAAVRDAPVIPLRFGVVFPDESQVVEELLDRRREPFEEMLDKIRDQVQMTLKGYYVEETLLREILESEPELARLREATQGGSKEATYNARVRLGELVNAAVMQRRDDDTAAIVERLSAVSVATTLAEPENATMAINAHLLVDRSRLDEFESAVEDVAQEQSERVTFKLLGPLPAYDFIQVEEPAWS
jgi:hypothetical protein